MNNLIIGIGLIYCIYIGIKDGIIRHKHNIYYNNQ
jgi:hypothetical protein